MTADVIEPRITPHAWPGRLIGPDRKEVTALTVLTGIDGDLFFSLVADARGRKPLGSPCRRVTGSAAWLRRQAVPHLPRCIPGWLPESSPDSRQWTDGSFALGDGGEVTAEGNRQSDGRGTGRLLVTPKLAAKICRDVWV